MAFLVALAFAVAASANLPAILLLLFWKRFNTRGAVWAIYGGLVSAVLLVLLSPIMWGGASATQPRRDPHRPAGRHLRSAGHVQSGLQPHGADQLHGPGAHAACRILD